MSDYRYGWKTQWREPANRIALIENEIAESLGISLRVVHAGSFQASKPSLSKDGKTFVCKWAWAPPCSNKP